MNSIFGGPRNKLVWIPKKNILYNRLFFFFHWFILQIQLWPIAMIQWKKFFIIIYFIIKNDAFSFIIIFLIKWRLPISRISTTNNIAFPYVRRVGLNGITPLPNQLAKRRYLYTMIPVELFRLYRGGSIGVRGRWTPIIVH